MSTATIDLSDPSPSAEFAIVDTDRVSEIATRHQRVADFLRQEKYAALLIQEPSNFAWLTAGACNERGGSTGRTGSIFVTPDARVLVCSNADTAQFFETEVSNMGFQLKERPWFEPRNVMVAEPRSLDVCPNRLSDCVCGLVRCEVRIVWCGVV